MARATVKRTNPGTGSDHVVFTDASGANREGVVLGIDGSDSPVPADATNGLDVDVTRLPALPAGTNNIGDVDVLSLPALPAGSNQIGTTLGPTITKGTQGSTGYTTQDLKDAGRNGTHFSNNFVTATNTEALVSLTGYKSGAAVGATTTPAVVTSGKTYRIEAMFGNYFAIATLSSILVRLRVNTGGTVSVSSPMVWQWIVGTTVATAGAVTPWSVPIPDGMEFAAGTGIGITILGLNTTGSASAAGSLGIQIAGYEY